MELSQEQKIFYYLEHPEYGFLSNFYPSPFKVYNQHWTEDWHYPTNQHFFQSKKFYTHHHQISIARCSSPFEAFELGRSRKFPYRVGWKNIKQNIMYIGLKHKFDQNPELKDKLMATRDKVIIEHDDTDLYWSNGGDSGKGKNRMGFLLMKLRDQYKSLEQQQAKKIIEPIDENSQIKQ